jgi:hypothetical protein
LIENAELKNQLADVKDGLSSNLDHASTKPLTPLSASEDECAFSFHYDRSPEPVPNKFCEWNDFEALHDVAPQDTEHLPRRNSLINLSKLNLSNRFRNPLSVNTAHSLFTRLGKRRETQGFSPKLIPRHIFFETCLVPVSDEVSEVSVEDQTVV